MAYSLERNLKDADGIPIIGAQTYVYNSEGALATLVTSGGDPATNPAVSGDGGYSAIFVADVGRFTLKHFWAGRERLIEFAEVLGSAVSELPASTDVTLASNTDSAVPTVRATKSYVDTTFASVFAATIYATWTDLSAATGMAAGDTALVLEDPGTHTDPVVSGTVDNAGIYIYSASPAGWERVADTEAVKAAESATLAQSWAEGTLPGGAGTKSAKEWAGEAFDSALSAGGFETPEYASQAAGEAATTEGQIFRVPLGTVPQTFAWYRRKASGSEAVSPLATTAALSASGGAGMVGCIAAGTDAVARTVQDKLRDFVSVKDYGATGDGVTDDMAAIQECFDRNQNAAIYFPYGEYKSSGSIVLVDGSGRNFQGDIIGSNATVVFTNAGSASDTDVNMQRGFAVYPADKAIGGDISGLRQSKISGLKVQGPLHGSCIHLANSQGVAFEKVHTTNSRYGVVTECCIHTKFDGATFENYTNAGVGLLMLGDTARVWYGSATPASSYWNDSPIFINCEFKTGSVTQALAHVLDHGSMAEGIRYMAGCYLYSRDEVSPGVFAGTQYGILCRGGNWTLERSWTENVSYPVRVLDAAAIEGGGNVTAVLGAEPGGAYAMSNFPDGYSYTLAVRGCFFARSYQDINCSGVRGRVQLEGNYSQLSQNGGNHIVSIGTSAEQVIIDDGAQIISAVGVFNYSSLVSAPLIDAANVLSSWVPTVSAASGTITTYTVSAAKFQQRGKWVEGRADILISDNGTGAGSLQVTPPVTAAVRGGSVCGREDGVSGKGLLGKVDGAQISIWDYSGAYPAVSGARIIVTFSYEAA